jgi:hypothetical protein
MVCSIIQVGMWHRIGYVVLAHSLKRDIVPAAIHRYDSPISLTSPMTTLLSGQNAPLTDRSSQRRFLLCHNARYLCFFGAICGTRADYFALKRDIVPVAMHHR